MRYDADSATAKQQLSHLERLVQPWGALGPQHKAVDIVELPQRVRPIGKRSYKFDCRIVNAAGCAVEVFQ